MSYRLYSFDGTVLPTRRAQADIGPGPAQDRTFELPSGGLYDYFGLDDAPGARSVLRHRGRIWNSTLANLEAEYNELAALKGVRGTLLRQRDSDGRWQGIDTRCMDVRHVRTVENQVAGGGLWLELDFEFQVLASWWNGFLRGSGWTLDTGEVLDDGLALDETGDHTMAASPYTGTWHNHGRKPNTKAVVTVTAGAAQLTAVTVARLVGGAVREQWTVTDNITTGNALVVDCGAWSVDNSTRTPSDAWAYFAFGATHQSDNILTLLPGDNTIRVTFTGGAADSTVNITFHDQWA